MLYRIVLLVRIALVIVSHTVEFVYPRHTDFIQAAKYIVYVVIYICFQAHLHKYRSINWLEQWSLTL